MKRLIRSLVTTLLLALVTGTARAQTDARRVASWLRAMPAGQILRVTLTSGEVLDGSLTGAEEHRFGLRTAADATGRNPRRSIRKWIHYEEVSGLSGEGIHVAATEEALAPFLEIGDKARIRTTNGEVVEGKIDDYDGATLRIEDRRLSLAEGDVVRIDIRERDSLLNGTLIGFGVGAGLSFLGWAGCQCSEAGTLAALLVGVGTGLGVLTDAVSTRGTTVYTGALSKERITIAPLLGRDAKGVQVSLRF